VRGFRSLAEAILKGFLRDRQAVFFSVFFPLMFLVLFGGVFAYSGQSRIDVVEVGKVGLIDDLAPTSRAAFDDAFHASRSDDLSASLKKVRDGDETLTIEQRGRTIVVHFSKADPVRAATAQGTLQSFVQSANVAATGKPPAFEYTAQGVEDTSLKTIQFVTPGLLGWAIATSATFGAASTLVGWRRSKLLRRLRLAPASTRSVVAARIGVTVTIALLQMLIFVGLAVALFGLKLSGFWWMSVPR
jgi:ABC-2 type transport system permease protein